jgi:addiction module HigA family antidote
VIRTFADETTRDIWNGVNSKAARRIPRELWPNVRRKLDQIDAVTRLDDLKVPPGNRLHALGADLRGFHAVRVNDQYRIVFRFEGGDAFDVLCTDYHWGIAMLPTHRPPTHPGEMLLKEFLEPLGVSQAEAATRMSIPFQRLNGIVKGRRAVSADTALLLDALTGWDAQIWLTLQAKWDLWHALKARGRRPKVRPLRKTA